MTQAAPLAEDDLPPTPHWSRARMMRQLERLDHLAGLGIAAAEALARPDEDETPPAPGDQALAFDRVARAVRLTVALQSRLVAEIDARDDGREIAVSAARAASSPANDDDGESGPMVVRWMDDDEMIDERGEVVRRPEAELRARDERERYDRLLKRPFPEILARICADLGLDPAEAWGRPPPEAFPPSSEMDSSSEIGDETPDRPPAPA